MSTFGEIKSDQLQEYFYIPAATIFPFAGTAAPTGFLFCDGSQYGTAAYSNLFSAVGYTYGGSGTAFRVPDLRGRVPAGRDASNNLGGAAGVLNTITGSGTAIGATGGSQVHQLNTNEMPAHTHGTSSISSGLAATGGNHNHSATTNPAGGHSHSYTASNDQNWGFNPVTSAYKANVGVYGANTSGVGDHQHTLTTSSHDGHQHSVTGNVVTNSAGGGTAHNNVQPTLIVNYIIKV